MDENHILFVVGKAFCGSKESISTIPTTRSHQSVKMIIIHLFDDYMLYIWMRSTFSFWMQSVIGRIDGLLYCYFIFLLLSWLIVRHFLHFYSLLIQKKTLFCYLEMWKHKLKSSMFYNIFGFEISGIFRNTLVNFTVISLSL